MHFANVAAPEGAPFGAHPKSKKYGLGDLWAKFGAFGRICTKKSLTPPTKPKLERDGAAYA